jgi:hypothetical protein
MPSSRRFAVVIAKLLAGLQPVSNQSLIGRPGCPMPGRLSFKCGKSELHRQEILPPTATSPNYRKDSYRKDSEDWTFRVFFVFNNRH